MQQAGEGEPVGMMPVDRPEQSPRQTVPECGICLNAIVGILMASGDGRYRTHSQATIENEDCISCTA